MTAAERHGDTWFVTDESESSVMVSECRYHAGNVSVCVADGTGAPAHSASLDFEKMQALLNVLVIEHQKQMAGWSDQEKEQSE